MWVVSYSFLSLFEVNLFFYFLFTPWHYISVIVNESWYIQAQILNFGHKPKLKIEFLLTMICCAKYLKECFSFNFASLHTICGDEMHLKTIEVELKWGTMIGRYGFQECNLV